MTLAVGKRRVAQRASEMIAPAANDCLGTGGCVSGHLGPMNCELAGTGP